ncbi:putative methyl-accepting chemotaxis protein [Comamonas sp. E6]|nr:putative methyl-accepting chemotaxis protein [Comamonas sp. E6]
MEPQSAMVLELADAALQVIEPMSQRTAAWQAFARCAVPQLGLGSLARLVALLQQYGPAEDAELALLLWQGEITQQVVAIKAVQRLRNLVTFLQSQGITDAASWLQWRASADAQAVMHGAPHQEPDTNNALLWHLDSGRCDVPWVLMFARRVLGQAPAHGHIMLAVQEMAEAMNLSAKVLARRIAWHERLFQALGEVPELRLAWWRCVKRILQAQLTNATSVKLQVQGVKEALPLSLSVHLRQGQPMLTIQLPRAFGAAPAWPNLTKVQLRQEGWGPGLGLRLLLQGEGALPAQLQLEIAKRWKAAQLQPPVFERISATKWEISCCWCDGLWKPSNLDHADVNDWATDTALQVLEYALVLKGMFGELQATKKP